MKTTNLLLTLEQEIEAMDYTMFNSAVRLIKKDEKVVYTFRPDVLEDLWLMRLWALQRFYEREKRTAEVSLAFGGDRETAVKLQDKSELLHRLFFFLIEERGNLWSAAASEEGGGIAVRRDTAGKWVVVACPPSAIEKFAQELLGGQ